MRKIIEITAIPENQWHRARVYALCDDGTLWERQLGGDWALEPTIPQPPPGPKPDYVPAPHDAIFEGMVIKPK